jgi:hypothetical protein
MKKCLTSGQNRSVFEIVAYIMLNIITYWGHAAAQWLRHCATNRKVSGSIPHSVIGIFHWHNPYGRTMSLESTHPLT